jgi:hypothetical protein
MKPVFFILAALLAIQCPTFASELHAIPFIDQPLVPISRAPGSSGFTLTVKGANFDEHSTVMWDGKARQTHFISGAEVQARILASDVARAYMASVTVRNPEPGGGMSNVVFFPVRKPGLPDYVAQKQVTTTPSSVIVTADFNHDGKLDLAVTLRYSNDPVDVLLGEGGGAFQPPVSYTVPCVVGDLAVADFNRDGKLDILVESGAIGQDSQLLLGRGDGTFEPPKDLGFGFGYFAVGDVNGDGNLDLIFTNNSLMVALGNGDGTFQAPVDIWLVPNSTVLSLGDFNGDGILDIALSNSDGQDSFISLFAGNGDGTFQPPLNSPITEQPFSMIAADFNGDGKLDLAGGSGQGPSAFYVYIGNGDGTFLPPVDVSVPSFPRSLAVGDFNADGIIDVATTDDFLQSSYYTSVVFGERNVEFSPALAFPTATYAWSLVPGFFNGEGNLDLAVATDTGVELFLQDFP